MIMTSVQPQFDATTFRRALGHVPTSVCVVTSCDDDGPTGMTVGSFTSISLDPPLVGFFADSGSATLQRVRRAGRFTVNMLADDQGALCQVFARKGADRFAGVPLVAGDHPAPRLTDALGWIDCELESVVPIGDHDAIVGRVVNLDVPPLPRRPLVFYRGTLCQLDARTVPSKGNWQRDHYAEW
ncbi:flavin reductase (DIM6/NTAB) family NADH-FMN oxidoreductase RutF [Micromonospora palomenae]|uniref:Flavin reductase (DIM6/NTAB) family NADH-FMN oxidoreductase RutF n=1 Tax=Micromonospora palomenae TaxID=1461247 RepID=A0A561WYL0_9ACTN|nr:flavin reductase family protein [Micromonospora palomenae]TWG28953.1 flavin reductase (DIM6/NTAB) family NADH-FMN oxidoreductase RutF [Micromonospora palomenae]